MLRFLRFKFFAHDILALFAIAVMRVSKSAKVSAIKKISRLYFTAFSALLFCFRSKQFVVLGDMGRIVLDQFKIVDRVIELVAVPVMDYFGFKKFSTNMPGHHKAMLGNAFSFRVDHMIAAMVDAAAFVVPSHKVLSSACQRTEPLHSGLAGSARRFV